MSSIERILERANQRQFAAFPPMPSFSSPTLPNVSLQGRPNVTSPPTGINNMPTTTTTSFFLKHKYLLFGLLLVLLVLVCIAGILIITKSRKRRRIDPINPNALPSLPNNGADAPAPAAPSTANTEPSQRPPTVNPEPVAFQQPQPTSHVAGQPEPTRAPVSRLRQRIRNLVYNDPTPRQSPPESVDRAHPLPVVSGSVTAQQADELAILQQTQRTEREQQKQDEVKNEERDEEERDEEERDEEERDEEMEQGEEEKEEGVTDIPVSHPSQSLTSVLRHMHGSSVSTDRNVVDLDTPSAVPLHVAVDGDVDGDGDGDGAVAVPTLIIEPSGVEETKSELPLPSPERQLESGSSFLVANEVHPVQVSTALIYNDDDKCACTECDCDCDCNGSDDVCECDCECQHGES